MAKRKGDTKASVPKEETNDLVDDSDKKSDAEGEEYNEDEDEDYDPEAKAGGENQDESEEESDNEPQPDYSSIENTVSQERLIKTRRQRIEEKYSTQKGTKYIRPGLIKSNDISQNIDVDAIFNDLQRKSKSGTPDDWKASIDDKKDKGTAEPAQASDVIPNTQDDDKDSLNPKKVKIESSYTFAGKVITESKLVDADSAEAKAYFNSTKGITVNKQGDAKPTRSFVPVIRTIPGSTEPTELRIKLKRPSLIDKFLSTYGNKKQKLSTLEKSRLDWASFVDKKDLKDDLSTHNKGGYLEKQEFLGRLQDRRDEHYQKAKEEDRKRQWQLQQQQM